MTVEERLQKLEDALTVEANLLSRHERLDEERHARIDAMIDAMAEQAKHTQAALNSLAEHQRTMTVAVNALIERQMETDAALRNLIFQIDRFIRGRAGNGEGQ